MMLTQRLFKSLTIHKCINSPKILSNLVSFYLINYNNYLQ